MSREVEVTGLKMTATVPEDIQISVGNLAKAEDNTTVAVEDDNISLASGTGTLKLNANNEAMKPVNSWDWSNSADISAYYEFGRIMPASSRDGATIFYTADATGTGRTVSNVAKYFAANSGLNAFKTGGTAVPATGEDSARATLHAITAKTNAVKDAKNDTWQTATYKKATGWDQTNDDGYYVDIPIWLRSSATEDINVKVEGYVLPGDTSETTNKTDTDLELYRAVRVALLNGDTQPIGNGSDVTLGSIVTTNNVLPLVDALDKTEDNYNSTTKVYSNITNKNDPYTGDSIVDSGIYLERTKNTTSPAPLYAVNELTAFTDDQITADKTGHIESGDNTASYTTYETYNGTSPVATIKARTDGTVGYGAEKKLIIRVWLDGEDTECWNDNAGQDWAISLKFSKATPHKAC